MTFASTLGMPTAPSRSSPSWLKRYYGARALFSTAWVILALTVGKAHPAIGVLLLIEYPAWDCVANLVDVAENGGLRANPTQLMNAAVSAVVMFAVAGAAEHHVHTAIGVIGVWAALSGLLQLSTGLRRRRCAGAQWPQMLSGAQSTVAAVHFVTKAASPLMIVGAADVAPYVAFGAVYFAISAAILAFKQ